MKHLTTLAVLILPLGLSSCALPGKLIQAPVRLIQAGVRTVTDVDDTTSPATAEAQRTTGLATKVSETIVQQDR